MDMFGEWPLAFGAFRASRPRWQLFLYLLFTAHMFPAVLLFRLQTFLFDARLADHETVGRLELLLATFLARINHPVFGVSLGHHVRTTGGLYIAHGHVVMDGVINLGHSVQVAPFVTLGLTNSEGKTFDLIGPTIGDHVNIGTGAKVIGPVTIGDHVKIGANAVVVDDVPAHHTAVGAPARSFPTVTRDERQALEVEPEAKRFTRCDSSTPCTRATPTPAGRVSTSTTSPARWRAAATRCTSSRAARGPASRKA
jgi:serine O-acetyltransferase